MIDGWAVIFVILTIANAIAGSCKDDFSSITYFAIATVCAGCALNRVFG